MRALIGRIIMSIGCTGRDWRHRRADIPGWRGGAAGRVGGSSADLRLRRRRRLERVGLLAVERSQGGTASDEADRNAENVPLTNLIAQGFGHRLSLRSPSKGKREVRRCTRPGLEPGHRPGGTARRRAFIASNQALIDIGQMCHGREATSYGF
jgi:hypothetical protein